MSTNSISGATSSLQSLFQQRQKDLNTLASDVQSGDITAAQSALSTYQTATQNLQSSFGQSNTSSDSQGSSKVRTDFSALVSAVQSGDISNAQSALGTFESDLSSASGQVSQAGGHHHHGHHHHTEQASASSISASSTASQDGTSTDLTSLLTSSPA